MKAISITLSIDTHDLQGLEDSVIASFWHVSQINPAPFGDIDACALAGALRTEIIRRWLQCAPLPLHAHQGHHVETARRLAAEAKDGQS